MAGAGQKKRVISIGVVGILALLVAPVAALRPVPASAVTCTWMDTTKSPDQRASELLAAMTIDDKIAMVHQPDPIFTHFGTAGHIPPNPALCIPDLVLNDAGQGVGDQIPANTVTAFPAPIAQAATWDRALQTLLGRTLGDQAWHKGINVQLAPDVNIARVPLNGRNFEAFGEDPFLAGQTSVAEIRGIQQNPVIADVKHYAANNQETNRMTSSSDVAERTLHEIYLPAFEASVKQGDVGSLMCSYNLLNTVYACENDPLLNGILKGSFGFQGFVVSDWGATHSTIPAANNGLDMEMDIFPGSHFGSALKTAVQGGQVPTSRLNDMVFRILRSMFKYGIFDHPLPSTFAGQSADYIAVVDGPASQQVARKTAADGMVLLKNDGGILPLAGGGKKIALIGSPTIPGPTGDELYYNGQGSSHVPEVGPRPVVGPVQGMQTAALGNGDTILVADGSSTPAAVAAASAANVAVFFAFDGESEGFDRSTLALNNDHCTLLACFSAGAYDQNTLLQSVIAANRNTVVVLTTGGPVLMPWLQQVKGVVEAWYPGQEMGNAIADVLFGAVNPSGKLPQTFPRSEADLPTNTPAQYPGVNLHVSYSEGLDVGYRWYDDKNIDPLFPFGHGLSYTKFGYSNLSIASAGSAGGQALASFDVANTGKVAGAEVAQVYVGAPPVNPVGEPNKQLRGFDKVFLGPGQSQHVSVPIDSRAVSYWNTSIHNWAVEAGCHPVLVGSSSRDIRLQGVGLDQNMQGCLTTAASGGPGNLPNTSAIQPQGASMLVGLWVLGLAMVGGLLKAGVRFRRRVNR